MFHHVSVNTVLKLVLCSVDDIYKQYIHVIYFFLFLFQYIIFSEIHSVDKMYKRYISDLFLFF